MPFISQKKINKLIKDEVDKQMRSAHGRYEAHVEVLAKRVNAAIDDTESFIDKVQERLDLYFKSQEDRDTRSDSASSQNRILMVEHHKSLEGYLEGFNTVVGDFSRILNEMLEVDRQGDTK